MTSHRTVPLALALTVLSMSAGCVSLKPHSQRASQFAQVIPNVPVRIWGDNSCGAGALSTVLNHWGDPVTEDELMATLKKGRFGGVVTIDLLLEARRRGFDAQLVRGDQPMIETALRGGKPVVIMLRILDAPGSGVDLFHYIVVDGTDPVRKLIRTQFGDGKVRWSSIEKLSKAWEGGGKATLLVSPRTADSPALADGALRAAVALEASGKLEEAAKAYQAIVQKNPTSTVALTNLGNVTRSRGEEIEAEKWYRQALVVDPDYRDALNNLGWLLMEQGRLEEAEVMARRAVDQKGPDRYLVLDTLGRIQAGRGACAAALSTFQQATEDAPSAHGARATILLTMAQTQRRCGMQSESMVTLQSALAAQPDEQTRREIEQALAKP